MRASSPPESRPGLPAPLVWLTSGAWRHVAFAALVAFFLFGVRPLMDSSESRYAEGSRSMLATGDWVVPHLRGRAHMTKPPLTYWLGAAGMAVLGQNAWGARLAVATATFLTILIAVQLAREFGFSEEEARLAGVVHATAIFPFISGNILTTDVFVTLWQAFAALAAWKVWNGAAHAGRWRLAFWGVLGLAFMTKGPPALFVLIPVALLGWFRPDHRPAARLVSIPGVALFIAVSASWFLYVIAKDPERLRYFVEYEIVDRVASDVHERDNPFYIYPPIIIGGMFPWLFGWHRIASRLWECWRVRDRRLRSLSLPGAFTVLWLGSSLLVFTIAKSRLPLYVLPLTVPCSVWLARYFMDGWSRLGAWSRGAAMACAVVACAYSALLVAFRPVAFHFAPKRSEWRMASELRRMVEGGNGFSVELTTPEKSSGVPFSIDFYSRLPLRSDASTKNLVGLAITPGNDGPTVPVSIIKHTQIKKMSERGVTFLLLAEGTRYAAVTLPEAATHFPKGVLKEPKGGQKPSAEPRETPSAKDAESP